MTKGKRILLVDDDSAIREGARLRLRASGYEVIDANDGGEGVAIAIQSKPDVIVMDVRMPRMNGLCALSELQENEHTRDIPVVMLSASLQDQQHALDAGARYFLLKPYKGADLISMVESATGDYRSPVVGQH